MSGTPATMHRLVVQARDQEGRPLAGAAFVALLANEPYGSFTDTDGHCQFDIYDDANGPLFVTATYDGQSKVEKIGLDQTIFVFTFTVDAAIPKADGSTKPLAPPPSSGGAASPPPWLVVGLVVFVALAIGAWFLMRPTQPTPGAKPTLQADQPEQVADRIARTCAGGRRIENESEVTAGLTDLLTKASGKVSVGSGDVGQVTGKIEPNDVGLQFYKAYIQCLTDQTNNSLKLAGVKVEGASPASAMAGGAADAPTGSSSSNISPGSLHGWSYYEELNGGPTEDGVLVPPGADVTPSYPKIAKGTVLKARRGFKIRSTPSSNGEIVENAAAASCVLVRSPPTHAVHVHRATSGGYLDVVVVGCP